MASINLLDSLKQMMTCSVCLEEKTDQKMLPCQHTLCVSCLNGVCGNRRSLNCPICKKSHAVPNGGVVNYPNSLVCNQLADILRQTGAGDSQDVRSKVADTCVIRKINKRKLITDLETEILISKSKLRAGEKELQHQKASLDALNQQAKEIKSKINEVLDKMRKYSKDRDETFQFLARDLSDTRMIESYGFSEYQMELTKLKLKLQMKKNDMGRLLSKVKLGQNLDELDKTCLLSVTMEPNDNLQDLKVPSKTPAHFRLRPNSVLMELQEKIRSQVSCSAYDEWKFLPSFSKFFPSNCSDKYREREIRPMIDGSLPIANHLRIRTENGCEGVVWCDSERVFWTNDRYSTVCYNLDNVRKNEILDHVFKDGEIVWLRRDLEYIPELYEPLTESSIGTVVSCKGSNVVINFPECENWTGDSEIFEFTCEIRPTDVAIITTDEYDNQLVKFKGQQVRVETEGAHIDEGNMGEYIFRNPDDLVSVTYRLPKYRQDKSFDRYSQETLKVKKKHLLPPMRSVRNFPSEIPVIKPFNTETLESNNMVLDGEELSATSLPN